ncbi:MAG: zinc-ribbon domain containing protein [Clostridia bacterium]|nr:zinc-ribbon domain containing protein [Clostridia bacterium]
MGIAKYYEDNIEIYFERMYLMDCRMREQNNQVQYDSCFNTTQISISVTSTQNTTQKLLKENKNTQIICKDCGRSFWFSAKSQEYYQSKGWQPPKRCKSCRDFRNTRYLMVASF